MLKNKWINTIAGIVKQFSLIELIEKRKRVIDTKKSSLKKEFVFNLIKSCYSYEMAKKLKILSNGYNGTLFESVRIDKDSLLEYLKRVDPELKKYGDIAEFSSDSKRVYKENSGWGYVSFKHMSINTIRFDEVDWKFIRRFLIPDNCYSLIKPNEIIKNYKKLKSEYVKEYRKEIASLRYYTQGEKNLPEKIIASVGNIIQLFKSEENRKAA